VKLRRLVEKASILLAALLLLEPLTLALVSVSFSTSNQLVVVIDKDTIPSNMGGWVTVTLLVPGASPIEKTLTVKQIREGNNTVKFSFDKRILRQKYLEFVNRAGKYVTYEASLQIVYYLVDNKGHTYIASYNLGTQSYYTKIKHLSTTEAHQRAIKNPLALLDARKITIKEKIRLINMTKAINSLVKTPKNDIGQTPRKISPQPVGIKPEQLYPVSVGSCPLLTTTIYNQELYNNRYNPPQEWLSQIELVSSSVPKKQVVKELWELFAELFSKQYYYPGYCSPEQVTSAISSTMLDLGPGIHFMDKLIARLAEYTGWYSVVAGWQDHYPPGSIVKHYDKAPIMRVTLSSTSIPLPHNIQLVMDVAAYEQHETKIGISIGGIIFLGYDNVVNKPSDLSPISIAPDGVEGNGVAYIFAPADIAYMGDAIAIVYHIDKTYLDGQEVWRVTPTFRFVPDYIIQYDYQHMDAIAAPFSYPTVQELNQVWEELVGTSSNLGLTYKLIYDKYISAHPYHEEIDRTRISQTYSIDLGGLVTLLFNAIGGELGAIFTANKYASLSKSALQVVIFSATNTQVWGEVDLQIYAAGINFNEVHVLVFKHTVKDEYLADIAAQYGYPLVFDYYASIERVS
jgi:hypothetical protein